MKHFIENLIKRELAAAREKFPDNVDMLPALMEEVGELSNAMLEHKRNNCHPSVVLGEAIQVAVMAIRIAEEGDANFPYKFEYQFPGMLQI